MSPCSYPGDPVKECTGSQMMITHHRKRISGPLMDRIDIYVEVPRMDYDKLAGDRLGEPSLAVSERIERALELPEARFAGRAGGPSGTCRCCATPTWARRKCASIAGWTCGQGPAPKSRRLCGGGALGSAARDASVLSSLFTPLA